MSWSLFRRGKDADAGPVDDLDLGDDVFGALHEAVPQSQPEAEQHASPHSSEVIDPELEAMGTAAFLEVAAEEVRRGKPFTDEERQILVEAAKYKTAIAFLQRSRSEAAADATVALLEELAGLVREIVEQKAAAEQSSPSTLAVKFWKDHPFLTGFLGAELVHRLKRTR